MGWVEIGGRRDGDGQGFCIFVEIQYDSMNWQDHIHSDPKILAGKPVVKGTRLSVVFILGLFSNGWTEQQVLVNYPQLTKESLRAVFSYIC